MSASERNERRLRVGLRQSLIGQE